MSRLLLGLGNVLIGDDGVGVRIAEALATDPGLPPDLEVRLARSDLLRAQDLMRGREEVILVDAVIGSEPPGSILRLDPDHPDLLPQRESAHQLSPVAALRIMRAVDRELTSIPVRLLGIVIQKAALGPELSPALAAAFDTLTRSVLDTVRIGPRDASRTPTGTDLSTPRRG